MKQLHALYVFLYTFLYGCNFLFLLGFKLIHVGKRVLLHLVHRVLNPHLNDFDPKVPQDAPLDARVSADRKMTNFSPAHVLALAY